MSDIEQDGSLWAYSNLYGVKTVPPDADYKTFAKAVLICAKGDGVLAPEERNWFLGRAACYGDREAYEFAKTYQADEDLLEVLAQSSMVDKNLRRIIIYVAIQTCSADGEYHPDERAKIHQMAKYLGIEENVVSQIEEFCMEEAKMREKRIGLMFPEGIPF
ncbi:MAG: TerB family tellurite resistance protein [Hormoscilla sp.]